MPLMTTKPMFDLAYDGGFAVGNQRPLIDSQGVALHNRQPALGGLGDLLQHGQEARVALHRDHPRPGHEQAARQAAWTRSDLDHGRAVQRPGQARDL